MRAGKHRRGDGDGRRLCVHRDGEDIGGGIAIPGCGIRPEHVLAFAGWRPGDRTQGLGEGAAGPVRSIKRRAIRRHEQGLQGGGGGAGLAGDGDGLCAIQYRRHVEDGYREGRRLLLAYILRAVQRGYCFRGTVAGGIARRRLHLGDPVRVDHPQAVVVIGHVDQSLGGGDA